MTPTKSSYQVASHTFPIWLLKPPCLPVKPPKSGVHQSQQFPHDKPSSDRQYHRISIARPGVMVPLARRTQHLITIVRWLPQCTLLSLLHPPSIHCQMSPHHPTVLILGGGILLTTLEFPDGQVMGALAQWPEMVEVRLLLRGSHHRIGLLHPTIHRVLLISKFGIAWRLTNLGNLVPA